MPLWLIYHTDDTFVDEESKGALARDITKFYTDLGLPAFYVVANFIKLGSRDVWVGGETRAGQQPFVRITIDHIAIHVPKEDDARYHRATAAIDALLKPHVADKGYAWEFHVDETERRLWKVNGFIPPAWKSAGEQLWAKENRAVPYEN
ncbi:putative oxalocrotonate tautomerase [Xylariales sp. PMI_506]|nr:putative oxalocrotonate tautomerase [Xylariales sp. PMI_506]